MKKLLLFSSFLVSFVNVIAQPKVTRSSAANTVMDNRLGAIKNFLPPVYADTTSANLEIGLDSCGALIFTYSTNGYWLRACNPKRWIQVGRNVSFANSNSVIFSGTGEDSDPIVANVPVSGQPNNIFQFNSNGAYVSSQIQNGLISGGLISNVLGSYTYDVTSPRYVIRGVEFTSPETQITLSNADPTYNRIDRVVATTDGQVVVIEGTPSDNPQEPSYDATTQLPLGFILVEAGTTEPTVISEYIYLNNSEWTTSASTARINPASTTNPYSVPLDVEGTLVRNGDYITFTDPSPPTDLSDYKIITFKIQSKAVWSNTSRIELRFYNGVSPVGNVVSISNNVLGFDGGNTSSYQTITAALSNFGLVTNVTAMYLTVFSTSGTVGFYIDDIQLQGGDGAVIPNTGQFWQIGGNNASSSLVGGTLDNFNIQFIANNTNHTRLLTSGATWLQGSTPGFSFQSGTLGASDYYFKRNGTDLSINSPGSITQRYAGNIVYHYVFADGHKWNSSSAVQQMQLNPSGQLILNNYGDNTFSGSPTYALGVDVNGNVVEFTPTSNVTADNGLSASGNNVQLGGTLLQSTTVNAASFQFFVSGSNTSNTMSLSNSGGAITVLDVSNTNAFLNGGAIRATTNASSFGSAISGTASSGAVGVSGTSSTNTGVSGVSTSGRGIDGTSNPSSTNTVVAVGRLTRSTSGTAANGIGGALEFQTEYNGGTATSNIISSKWTDATLATRTSQLIISGVSSTTDGDILTLNGNKSIQANGYGSGSFTGTATYLIATDASGNLIEVALGGGSMTNPMTTTGDLIYATDNSGTPGRLPIGSPGEVLAVNGTGDGYEFISAGSVGTVTSVDLTGSDFTFSGNPITAAGSIGITLATVNSNVGSFGSSTAIPTFTVNAKGLITASSTNSVIAPAGTLTGTTLASNVVTSSLTSVGIIASGTWQGTAIATTYGGAPTGGTVGQVLRKNSSTNYDYSWSSGAAGTVTNVTGTSNRITVATGTTTPVIDISASYVGQASITTLGTISTGVWNATAIGINKGGTGFTSATSGTVMVGNGVGAWTQATPTGFNGITVTMGSGSFAIGNTYNATFQTLSDASTINWNVTNGGNALLTLSGTGRTLNIQNPVNGHTYTIVITQGSGGSKTITTWPAGTIWPNASPPGLSTTAGSRDVITLTYTGSNYIGDFKTNFN